MVSVIIPSYNCAAFLAAAVESALAQTYTDIEVIVVDDGSTDATADVAAPYLDRIKFIQQPNRGLPAARNAGIRASTGEFIALLDADDSWKPEKLERQMPLFVNPEIGIVYSDFITNFADGRVLDSYLAHRPLACEGDVIDSYIQSRFLFPSTMVLRRPLMEECGLFDEEMRACEDIELFARMCVRCKVARVQEQLVYRYEGAHNITANEGKLGSYTILALEKILAREPGLRSGTRRVIRAELGQQYSWRAYRRSRAGENAGARADLMHAVANDPKRIPGSAKVFLATVLPKILTDRLRGPSPTSGRAVASASVPRSDN